MNNQWEEFLIKNQGKIIGEPVDDLYKESYMTDLSHLSLITLSGKDVVDFLHGQFTTDIKLLTDYELQFTAWCNAKGQVVNTLYIYRYNNHINILIPEEVKEFFLNRLQLYILRSDVRIIENIEKVIIGIRLTNNQSGKINFLSDLTTRPGSVIHQNDKVVIHLHGLTQRFIVIDNLNNMMDLWEQLSTCITPVVSKQWTIMDIQEGIPWITEKTKEQFLPQFLNLDHLDAVNYKKGCYPGQEIIARLHFRGKPKRGMFLCNTDKITNAKTGEDLYIMDKESPVGTILSLQTIHDKYEIFLAVIEIAIVNVEKIFINNNQDNLVRLQKLPYIVND